MTVAATNINQIWKQTNSFQLTNRRHRHTHKVTPCLQNKLLHLSLFVGQMLVVNDRVILFVEAYIDTIVAGRYPASLISSGWLSG